MTIEQLQEVRKTLLEIQAQGGIAAVKHYVNDNYNSVNILKVLKPIYGIPPAGAEWATKLQRILTEDLKFKRCHVDGSVYYRTDGPLIHEPGPWKGKTSRATVAKRTARSDASLAVVASARSMHTAQEAHRTAVTIAAATKRVGKLAVYASDSPALGYLLGEGSMGTTVYKGKHAEWGEVAVERMFKVIATKHTAEKEVQLLLTLANAGGPGSDNVAKYRSLEKDAQHIYISMELCAFSLHDAIEQFTGVMLPADRRQIAVEMAAGVAFLHR
jgi:hypothetical protein